MTIVRFLVRGRVQGVGFRWFVSRQARALGIGGYVRNLPDGTVEVLAQSDDPTTIEKLAGQLRQGPSGAAVTSVEREDRSGQDLTMRSFDIR